MLPLIELRLYLNKCAIIELSVQEDLWYSVVIHFHNMVSPSVLRLYNIRLNTSNVTFAKQVCIWDFISGRVATYGMKTIFMKDVKLIDMVFIWCPWFRLIEEGGKHNSLINIDFSF